MLYEEKFYFSEGRHFLNAEGSDFVAMVVAFGDDGRRFAPGLEQLEEG